MCIRDRCAREYIDREINGSLSGGELKRIEIAMITARGTKLSIFDEGDRKKIRLEGEVPSPINTKPGCKFQGRCKYAKDICRQQMPELKDVGNNHFVACHFCDALEENKEL